MVVRARRILVDRRGGSGGRGDAGLVDAVSADASQNPMYRRQDEQALKYEEELNGWQLPARSCRRLHEEAVTNAQVHRRPYEAWASVCTDQLCRAWIDALSLMK